MIVKRGPCFICYNMYMYWRVICNTIVNYLNEGPLQAKADCKKCDIDLSLFVLMSLEENESAYFVHAHRKVRSINPFSAGTACMLMQTGWIQASRRVRPEIQPVCYSVDHSK